MTNIVTPDGLTKAEQKLAELYKQRKEISARIQAAKEQGDLSENAEYAQARDDQSFLEGKIEELEALVKDSVVVAPTNNGGSVVGIGSRVTARSDAYGEREYTIVGANESDPIHGCISVSSPLAEALLGHAVGDRVDVETPRGVTSYTIVAIA